MKTKTFNHFRNIFAFIGFFIIACSAAVDDSPIPIEPPVVQSNIGKYQIAQSNRGYNTSTVYLSVINTETGVMKTYSKSFDSVWTEQTIAAITFTH
ncbi:hypothetical protein OAR38_04440 [Flavobacteriaceae bacterium]|nr:hypothetical protein [Flavobacteriaceae bacterium]MDC0958777.1 hypothetical protein [Flavobacteriaceae bacterium]